MEIRDARSTLLAVPFSNLMQGETFMSGANLFMRLQASPQANAVVLSDGRLVTFHHDDEVVPVKAYIVKEA